MARTKSVPNRHPSYELQALRSGIERLPYDVRGLLFQYYVPDADSYFRWLGYRINRYDAGGYYNNRLYSDGFYHTGYVRFKVVFPDGEVEYRRGAPEDETYKRSLQPGIRVFQHAGDLRQRRMWVSYGKAVIGNGAGTFAQALDCSSGRWKIAGQKYCRFYKNPYSDEQRERAENQGVRTLSVSDCTTHTFQLGFVSRRLYPQHISMYESVNYDQCCYDLDGDEEGSDERPEVHVSNGRTEGTDGQSDPDSDDTEPYSDSEESEESIEECDGCLGEEDEGSIVPEYDGCDRLYFRGPVFREKQFYQDDDKYYNQRTPNAHLKSSSGTTIFEPLSWRLSIIPKWRTTHKSEYGTLCGHHGVVIGRRYSHLAELYQAISHYDEDQFTVWYDNSPSTVAPHIANVQYYHIGIVPAFVPQPSFAKLSKNPLNVILPLLEPRPVVYHGRLKPIQISPYTLKNGLKRKAVRAYPVRQFQSILAYPDIRYV